MDCIIYTILNTHIHIYTYGTYTQYTHNIYIHTYIIYTHTSTFLYIRIATGTFLCKCVYDLIGGSYLYCDGFFIFRAGFALVCSTICIWLGYEVYGVRFRFWVRVRVGVRVKEISGVSRNITIYVHIHIKHQHTYIHIYIYTHVHTRTHTYTHIYTHTRVRSNIFHHTPHTPCDCYVNH